jgi:LemA protein
MTWIVIGIIFVVALIGGLLVGTTYNRLVTMRNRYKNAFAQIDVQLNRRYDLIPNLVEVAKQYMSHERETLEGVTRARTAAVDSLKEASADPSSGESMRKLSESEGGLEGALGRLFALAENYPDLKANQNMMQLSEELTSTENKVAFARQAFNDSVMNYNNAREIFPATLMAGTFGFGPAELLEIEEPEKREAVRVSF